MARSFYLGKLVPKKYLPSTYSYDPRSITSNADFFTKLSRDQQLEIARPHAERLAEDAKRIGTSTSVEHLEVAKNKRVAVGGAEDCWVDPEEGMLALFSVDGKEEGGDTVQKLLDNGYFKELSLSHDQATLQPTEISICRKGAREGTWIRKLNEQEYNHLKSQRSTSTPPLSSLIISASVESMSLAAALGSAPPVAPAPAAQPATPPAAPQVQMDTSPVAEAVDPLTSAFAKIASRRTNLRGDELDAVAEALLSAKKQEAEGSKQKDQKVQIACKMLAQCLEALGGETKDFNGEKAGAEIADSFGSGDKDKFLNALSPILVQASDNALRLQQARAQGFVQQQAPAEPAVDPRANAMFNAYMTYHSMKTNPSASTLSLQAPVFPNYQSPAIQVNATSSSMPAARQVVEDNSFASSMLKFLPTSKHSQQLNSLGRVHYGQDFVPSQTWQDQNVLKFLCNTTTQSSSALSAEDLALRAKMTNPDVGSKRLRTA